MIQGIFTTGQVARACRVCTGTVVAWAEKGILPCYRLPGGGDRRITSDALTAFLVDRDMPTDVLAQMEAEAVEHARA